MLYNIKNELDNCSFLGEKRITTSDIYAYDLYGRFAYKFSIILYHEQYLTLMITSSYINIIDLKNKIFIHYENSGNPINFKAKLYVKFDSKKRRYVTYTNKKTIDRSYEKLKKISKRRHK